MFENDVKTYGTQAKDPGKIYVGQFENDVKTYGTQALLRGRLDNWWFENDVKTYGTQADFVSIFAKSCLRMM